jgi:transposase
VRDYNTGMSTKDIAAKYHIALTSVYNSLARANTKMRYCKNAIKPLAAKIDINKLAEMKKQGLGTAFIANYFGVAKSSVKRMVNRHKNIIFPRVSDILAS